MRYSCHGWAFVRNVSYVLSVLVIIGLALHLIMATRTICVLSISLGLEVNLMNIIIVIVILLFITFSYILVRGVVEGSEVVSRFSLNGSADLFNIVFAGASVEKTIRICGFSQYGSYQQRWPTRRFLWCD